MRWVTLGLVLSECGPVLVGDEQPRETVFGDPLRAADAGAPGPAAEASSVRPPEPSDEPRPGDEDGVPRLTVSIEELDCECFALSAQGAGGYPPYRFEWDDGGSGQLRVV